MAKTKNTYALPFRKKGLIKAVSDPRAHLAHFKHAVDFILPIGTRVLAPKAGTVVGIKVNSSKGGPAQKYDDIRYLNYMTIKHANGEYSQYMHLKHNGALVRTGEKVRAGQPIALSGNTGLSTAPHLHFQVLKINKKTKAGWETLRIMFKEKVSIDRKARPLQKKLHKILEKVKEGQSL